jgi:hypothetical protein
MYVPVGQEPHAELTVAVEQNLPLPHHEDRYREVPIHVLSLHDARL